MPELIDLVDPNGKVVEKAVTRDDAEHRDGLHMQIVIAVIFNGLGQVLVHERAATKSVNAGDVDHVCGGMLTGETPEQAAIREAEEEVGITPQNLRVVRQGVNSYNRYCYLLAGESNEQPPEQLDPQEVAWASYYDLDELVEAEKSGRLSFVDGFFEDIEAVSAK